jgi:asparagine synthase (glutamine-hydrolysing)
MSAIAGILYPNQISIYHMLNPLLEILEHRGGKEKKIFNYKHLEMGVCHSREQAAFFETEGKNGLILLTDGIKDPEALLEAYRLYDLNFLKKMEGSFALALLDKKKDRLILARDPLGKKPLYWYDNQGFFFFSSELKALLATKFIPQTPSKEGLSAYLNLGYFPQELTPIENVYKLLPGHLLVYPLHGAKTIRSFWSFHEIFHQKERKSLEDVTASLESNFLKQESLREGQVGCLFNGGPACLTITELLKKNTPSDCFHLFSMYYQYDKNFIPSRDILKKLNIRDHPYLIREKEVVDEIVKILWYLDEPITDPYLFLRWKQAEVSSNLVSDVYSGLCLDTMIECHKNYHNKTISPLKWAQQKGLSFLSYLHPAWALQTLKNSSTLHAQYKYFETFTLFSAKELSFASPALYASFSLAGFINRFLDLEAFHNPVDSLIFLDLKSRITDSIFLQHDRFSAVNKISWHTPFLSVKGLNFFATVNNPDKKRNSYDLVFEKYLSSKNLLGFVEKSATLPSFPLSWMQSNTFKELFMELKKGSLVETGLINREWIDVRIQTAHCNAKHFELLWAVLILEVWFALNINRAIEASPPQISIDDLFKGI